MVTARAKYRVVEATPEAPAESTLVTAPAAPQLPTSESWRVNTETYDESGRVYLELADATPSEATRGLALLKKMVG